MARGVLSWWGMTIDDTTAHAHATPHYQVMFEEGSVPVKHWTRGVPVEDAALRQLANVAKLPFIHRWVAVMPDVHVGAGATVGSVIPTKGAIIPAAVGVDLGCGMMAVRTSLSASELPDHLGHVRAAIEAAVPHGRTEDGRRRDKGAWGTPPAAEPRLHRWPRPRRRKSPA